MLVLSRKADQKICFPSLGIAVQILGVKGSTVRVGVDAPTEVRIIRGELEGGEPTESCQSHVIRLPQQTRHEMRNQLNALSIALHLFKQELDAGQTGDAEATFNKLVDHLERLCCSPSLSQSTASTTDRPKSRALLVEDEVNEREMLAGFLRLHGYDVVTASNGLEAIEYLESNEKPAVVLIDMRMPTCDGPTTIRRIRENPAFDTTRIFAISGSTPEENHINAKDEGVNGWFMKPLNPKSLVDAMMTTTGSPASIVA